MTSRGIECVCWKTSGAERASPVGKLFNCDYYRGSGMSHEWGFASVDRGCENLSETQVRTCIPFSFQPGTLSTDIISNCVGNNLAPEWWGALQSATSIRKHLAVVYKKYSNKTEWHMSVCLWKSQGFCLWGCSHWKKQKNNSRGLKDNKGKTKSFEDRWWGDWAKLAHRDCFQCSETWLLVFTLTLSLSLYSHTHIYIFWLPQHGSSPVSRPGFSSLPKRGLWESTPLSSTGWRDFFFPLTKWGKTGEEKGCTLGFHFGTENWTRQRQ